MKMLSSFALTLLVWVGGQAFASETASGFCSGCDQSTKSSLATEWATANISQEEAHQNVRKRYNVIDTVSESTTTFEVYKTPQYVYHVNPPGYVYVPRAEEVESESETLRRVDSLFSSVQAMSTTIDTIEIPADVIEDAWEFTGCAYCANEITDYLRSHDDVSTRLQSIENVLGWLNIVDGKLNQEWILTLENGGEVHVEISLIHKDEVLVADIVRVIDRNNNDVTLDPTRLSGNVVLQGSMSYYRNIQHYLIIFGHKFEESHGRVTVRECRMPGDSPSNKPECYPH